MFVQNQFHKFTMKLSENRRLVTRITGHVAEGFLDFVQADALEQGSKLVQINPENKRIHSSPQELKVLCF